MKTFDIGNERGVCLECKSGIHALFDKRIERGVYAMEWTCLVCEVCILHEMNG